MSLLSDLSNVAVTHDLDHGWKRSQVKSLPELRDPTLLKPHRRAYMTSSSVTIKDSKTKRMVGDSVQQGELSRAYLKLTMANALDAGGSKLLAKRVPWRREALQFLDRAPAYYFAGQAGGPFELVDIKACYASLYMKMTLDLTYRPDTDPPLLGLGRAVFPHREEWMEAKGPRNAAWGTVLRTHGPEWRHGELIRDAYPNSFFAPDLRGFVLDCTNAIALEAIERFGALSWAVDGGAFRPGEGHAFIHWLGETWGLVGEVRAEGPGWLFGATSYAIGSEVTEDVRKGHAAQWPATLNLRHDVRRQWLADAVKGQD